MTNVLTTDQDDNVQLATQQGGIATFVPQPYGGSGGNVTLTGAVTGTGPATGVPTTIAPVIAPTTIGGPTAVPSISVSSSGQVVGLSAAAPVVTVTLTGAVTGSGPTSGSIGTTIAAGTPGTVPTVANIAALEALATTGFAQGQLAVVESVGAIWSYQPAGALTVDGITIVAAATAGQWWRGPTLVAASAIAQVAWYVDPQNVETTSSDENTGLTAATALKTKAEIARRWGTWSPAFSGQNVVITYLSADTTATASDPGLFSPFFSEGATLAHTAALPAAAFTGEILAVAQAKSITANHALQLTFTTTTGAMAAALLLVNATRGNSRAWAQRNTSGSTWQITQPFSPYAGSGNVAPVMVDTWAAGDAISGYAPLAVDIAILGGVTTDAGNELFEYASHVCWQISIFDPYSDQYDFLGLYAAAFPTIVECNVQRSLKSNESSTNSSPTLFNCALTGFQNCCTGSATIESGNGTMAFWGGFASGTLFGNSWSLSWNCYLCGGSSQVGSSVIVGNTGFDVAGVFIDGGIELSLSGLCILTSDGCVWGPGFLDNDGIIRYAGQTAVRAFPIGGAGGGGIRIGGAATTAYSNATAAGVTTVHGGITLNAANLDAAAGAAGFGGYAFGGGATYTNGAQP